MMSIFYPHSTKSSSRDPQHHLLLRSKHIRSCKIEQLPNPTHSLLLILLHCQVLYKQDVTFPCVLYSTPGGVVTSMKYVL